MTNKLEPYNPGDLVRLSIWDGTTLSRSRTKKLYQYILILTYLGESTTHSYYEYIILTNGKIQHYRNCYKWVPGIELISKVK